PSGIGGKIRTVLREADFRPESGAKSGQFCAKWVFRPESGAKSGQFCPKPVFHPESEAKSGQFCPKWVSIRNSGQNPDSSAQSGFPSGIRGKIRTVSKVFHFHPFC
ncbi:MAG TPA: hypothetical protein H9994_00475, partial [Candidatus Salinicoccus merdavium]|nr:hypothetical protein [Candidatus Salinicoccus merdavium]